MNLLAFDFCTDSNVAEITRIVDIVITALFVVVPVILLFVGIMDLIKAITSQKDDEIKKYSTLLIKKVVAAAVIFLSPLLITILLNFIGNARSEEARLCANLQNAISYRIEKPLETHKYYLVPLMLKDCSIGNYAVDIISTQIDGVITLEANPFTNTISDGYNSVSCTNYKIDSFEGYLNFYNADAQKSFNNDVYIEFELNPEEYDRVDENGTRYKTYTIYNFDDGRPFTPKNSKGALSGVQIEFETDGHEETKLEIKYRPITEV